MVNPLNGFPIAISSCKNFITSFPPISTTTSPSPVVFNTISVSSFEWADDWFPNSTNVVVGLPTLGVIT